jgi:hypothetical protein
MDIPGFAGLSRIADFRLKCCILKEDTKNNISGSNIQKLFYGSKMVAETKKGIRQNHLIP